MSNRSVQLYKYVPLSTGWRYCRAVFYPNNRIKPHAVLTPTGDQVIREGQYYLHFARRWEPVGDDPQDAFRALMLRRGELLTVSSGGTLASGDTTPVVGGTLRGQLDAWLDEIKDGGFHRDTYDAKRLVADEFCASCKGVKLLSAVTRKHCLQYVNAYLRQRGNSDRTRFNKFLHLRQFLQSQGLGALLTTRDAPAYSVKDPVAFEDEELRHFWSVCPPHKVLRYEVLLTCGLRKQEIETLRWKDVIFNEGIIRVQPRPEWGYTPKKHHCRDIPLRAETLEKLKHLKQTAKYDLVFHTASGKPLLQLWDDVQALFRKVNKRNGNVVPMDKAHPHTFRATFCTTHLRQHTPVPDVMRLMGHRDVESTMRYMACLSRGRLQAWVQQVEFPLAFFGPQA